MSLAVYRKKRTFHKTPEPIGKEKQTAGPLTFVIQKHEASRLHYDFRLELNGVLKSWAVPKGPSLNPPDKHLAVLVEDHPITYAKFEGTIPKGNYGAGTVMVWDKGVYAPLAFVDRNQAQVLLTEQLKKGHLAFVLLGEKLRGEFALIKTQNSDDNAWLLIKKNDEYASQKDILLQNRSVLTGRSMEEIKLESENKRNVRLSGPEPVDLDEMPKGFMPRQVKPMLAYSTNKPFDNKDWLFEIKLDGYRAIAQIQGGDVKLYSRNGVSFNDKFSPIVDSLQKFPQEAVFDGEIVVIDSAGHPHFQWVQEYPEEKQGELVYYIFDLLYYAGYDLTNTPLYKRKALLKAILPPLSGVRYCDHIEGSGVALFRQMQKLGVEGVMAKHKESSYKQGERSHDWLKIKILHRQEIVIAGFTKPQGGRKYFGSLLAGDYKNKKLTYIGHVGGGFDERDLKYISDKLRPLIQNRCPFEQVPQTNTPATWVKPVLLAEVAFSHWTKDHQMRHPVFLGLRIDKDAKEVTQESYLRKDLGEDNKKVMIEKQMLRLTNLSKVFWPNDGYTKRDLIAYYREIAPVILPYVKDRPESLLRYPNGITGKSFYQKDARLLDVPWIKKRVIHSESGEKDISYLLCQNEASLLYLINLGCIDLNPWSSRVGMLDNPDYLIIDFDPENTAFSNVVTAVLATRNILEGLSIPSFCKTSGAKGMHVYIPLGARYTYEQSRKLAELLCMQVHTVIPGITSMKRNPQDRQGLVYLDYLQNIRGQTLASVYSVRAQPGAPVSAPLLWSEVNSKLHPAQFTIKNMQERIQKHGDLFRGVLGRGIDMEKVLEKMTVIKSA